MADTNKKGKEIRVRFVDLDPAEEQIIRNFLKQGIVSGALKSDDHSNTIFAKSNREYARVFMEGTSVTMKTQKSEKLEAQELTCEILDLSQGGMSISVSEDTKLAKNSTAEFTLDFLEPTIQIQGQILGLQFDG